MSLFFQILVIVSFVLSIPGVFMWFGIKPQDIAQFFAKRRLAIGRYGYFIFACILTAFYLFVVVSFPIFTHVFNTKWLVISGILIWSLLGVWLPILQRRRSWNPGAIRTVNIVSRCLAAIVLIGFWFAVWPDWRTPLVVTILLIIVLVASYVLKYHEEIRRGFQKAVQLVVEVKFVKGKNASKGQEDTGSNSNSD